MQAQVEKPKEKGVEFLTKTSPAWQAYHGSEALKIEGYKPMKDRQKNSSNKDGNWQELFKLLMAETDLKQFLIMQKKLQTLLTSMDGLKSVGYEFEFGTFVRGDTKHSSPEDYEKEIIPSHQLLASSKIMSKRFELGWRLESDSLNTLELVCPPLIFTKDETGEKKKAEIKRKMEEFLSNLKLPDISGNRWTMKELTDKLADAGMGSDWNVTAEGADLKVAKKVKGGSGQVYGQLNESMYPEEIATLLENQFGPFQDGGGKTPAETAIRVQKILAGKAGDCTSSVKAAMNVFARYASNVYGIPSMMCRQNLPNKPRVDTIPTEIKETFSVWIKTDIENVIKPLLKNDEDRVKMLELLKMSADDILRFFDKEVSVEITQSLTNSLKKYIPRREAGELIMRDETSRLREQGLTGPALVNALKQVQLDHKANNETEEAYLNRLREFIAPFIKTMMKEIEALIKRVLASLEREDHTDIDPTSKTSDFLDEQYGEGRGVRTGTYIKGISTSKGNMYVVERR